MKEHSEPEADDVRAALATLVATEPDLPLGSADIELRGRRRLAQRRWGGAVAAALVVAAAGVGAVNLTGGSGPAAPVAQPPAVSEPGGNTGLAEGFPIGSAVDAVGAALPAGFSLGELPMDVAWQPGGLLDVPVTTAAGTVTLVVQVDDGRCAATVAPVDVLAPADLDAIAASVCTEWVAGGSLPVIPGEPGAEQPDLAAQ